MPNKSSLSPKKKYTTKNIKKLIKKKTQFYAFIFGIITITSITCEIKVNIQNSNFEYLDNFVLKSILTI